MSLLVAGSAAPGQVGSQMTGLVRDASEAPVAGVLLTLSSLDRAFQTESALDGRFRFEIIPPGRYDLEVSATGFLKQKLSINSSETTAQPLTIVLQSPHGVPGADDCGLHPSISYRLRRPNSPHLTGSVRDYSDGRPVGNAAIVLRRGGKERVAFRANSDQRGKVEFNELPAGRYELRVLRRGYRPMKLNQFLVPRESEMSVNFPILKRNAMIACE